MPNKYVPVQQAQFNFWNMTYQFFFARGFIRLPLTIGIPFVGLKVLDGAVDDQFKYWNAGYGQADVWNDVEARTKQRMADADGESEE